jgi:hypothetical protein
VGRLAAIADTLKLTQQQGLAPEEEIPYFMLHNLGLKLTLPTDNASSQ